MAVGANQTVIESIRYSGNGATLLGVNPFWQMVIEGLLIAGVVYPDNVQKRRAQGQ